MLLELGIQNFILIDDIRLSFAPGLSVITGETGAGKSILLEGIRIALGAPASKDNLRDPMRKGAFEIVIEEEEEILSIHREVFPSGKSLSRLQGIVTTLPQIRETIAPHLDIYAQKEDSLLLHPSSQRDVLDRYHERVIQPLLLQVQDCRREDERIDQEIERLQERSQLSTESLEFELRELSALRLDPQSDARIEEEFHALKSIESVLSLLSAAIESASAKEVYSLEDALDSLGEEYQPLRQRAESVRLELEDMEQTLREKASGMEEIPLRAAQIEERYSALFAAKRKYRKELHELAEREKELEEILEEQSSLEEALSRLEKEKKNNYQQYLKISQELSEHRKKSFTELRDQMLPLLEQINLKGARIDVEFQPRRDGKIHLKGDDNLTLTASINAGALRPLSQVLSGGELSRFMLALKAVFGREDSTKTLIFDEIDAGISGKTAFEVGRLLRQLSKEKQIIAITHQPQLVSFADHHFYIEKNESTTTVVSLSPEQHREKLALMLSPARTETAMRHAEQMIRQAKEEE